MIKTVLSTVASFVGGNKIWLAIVCALVGIIIGSCVFFKISNDSMIEKISDLNIKLAAEKISRDIEKSNLKACGDKLETQNAKFEALEVKTQDAIKEANKAKARFKKLAAPSKDDACEKKLKFYEDAAAVTAKSFKERK
ncbi:hypothetical protein [Campylobacter sp. RM16187]|uniref:hypothetical protein n=1 Tax=Campylobacter sp. RM16187 TaxID=1660063 RepID=UPI0021B59195|nr:hypothetical protein [Campylobacter sp. RM16187]QKG29199.1 hypothetical protein CDOMF_0936 [Campylobacter sp. RM16187]